MWDLFHLLVPKDYKDKSFESLTAYEKLYVELFERYHALELSHRLNLKGNIELKYDDKILESINLEGQQPGFSIMQLKNHLLKFSAENHHHLSPGFVQALDKILDIKPQIDLIRNNHTIDSINIFIFSHVNHGWGALLTENKLYLVNMGLGSDKTPGIQVYQVPPSKRKSLFNHLKALENTNLVDDLNKEPNGEMPRDKDGEIDWNEYGRLIQQRYIQRMEFDHYKNISKKFKLKEIERITIPAQEAGNCSYYSPKGLFLALMYEFNQQHYPQSEAYQKSLNDFLKFVKFDYDNAVKDYQAHALRPNTELLTLAKNKLNAKSPLNRVNAVNPNQYKRQTLRK